MGPLSCCLFVPARSRGRLLRSHLTNNPAMGATVAPRRAAVANKSGVRVGQLTPRAVVAPRRAAAAITITQRALSVQRIEQIGNGFHAGREPSVLSVSNPFYPLTLCRPFSGQSGPQADGADRRTVRFVRFQSVLSVDVMPSVQRIEQMPNRFQGG